MGIVCASHVRKWKVIFYAFNSHLFRSENLRNDEIMCNTAHADNEKENLRIQFFSTSFFVRLLLLETLHDHAFSRFLINKNEKKKRWNEILFHLAWVCACAVNDLNSCIGCARSRKHSTTWPQQIEREILHTRKWCVMFKHANIFSMIHSLRIKRYSTRRWVRCRTVTAAVNVWNMAHFPFQNQFLFIFLNSIASFYARYRFIVTIVHSERVHLFY